MEERSRIFLGLGECMVELAPNRDGLFRQGFAGDVFKPSGTPRGCSIRVGACASIPHWGKMTFRATSTNSQPRPGSIARQLLASRGRRPEIVIGVSTSS